MVTDREMLRTELTTGLSQGQADALMLMIAFLGIEGPDMFVLKGYAGTGKTFLVKTLIKYITKNLGGKIAVTAPTNKAVQVLMSRKDFSGNVVYQTIHSLLGLTETITDKGELKFTSKGDGQISKIKYLIVDEGSMLQDEIYHLLEKHSSKVKIIFMGDPAQIPPVGKVDCIPFKQSLSTHFEEGYTLTQIMRQAEGNPIIEASFKIRDQLNFHVPIPILITQHDDKGHGLTWIDPATCREELLHQLEKHFTSKEFKNDPNYAKVIAWRNRTVATVNQKIRSMIYPNVKLDKIMPGEALLADKPIFNDEGGIEYNTSEEFEIRSATVEPRTLNFGNRKCMVKVYNCKILPYNPIGNPTTRIRVIHEDSEKDYSDFLEGLKTRAKSTFGKMASKAWIDYYNAVKWPANVSYNYAITAHKSQGSTYENVFIMEDDIDANHNVIERNRIKYTSYSRASKNLYVYRTNP